MKPQILLSFVLNNLGAFHVISLFELREFSLLYEGSVFIFLKKLLTRANDLDEFISRSEEEIKNQTEIKDLNFKIDADILKQEIENKTGKKFTKIIAVLQKRNWNLTCLNGLDMNRMNIDAYTGEIEKKDEGSLMDMVRFKKS